MVPSGWGLGAAGRGLGLERFRNGTFKPFSAPNFDDTKITVLALLLDRDGSLWVATANNGLYRIHGNNADHFGLADGLSGNSVTHLYEDQEGIIWASTSNGLDSFWEPRVTTYSETEGPGAAGAVSVTVSHDGTVWLANNGSLDSIHNGTVVSTGIKDGLPGNQVTSLLEDREGHLWVGVDDGLYIYENRHFRSVPSPNRGPMGMIVGMTEDIDGNIWAEMCFEAVVLNDPELGNPMSPEMGDEFRAMVERTKTLRDKGSRGRHAARGDEF